MNNNRQIISWSAHEYEHREKRPDWFWALGVIAVSGTVASIIFGNFLFAIFIVLGTILLGYYSIKKPDLLEFQINEKGIQIEDMLYPYTTIKSFWIDSDETKHNLLIHVDRLFMPIVTLPLADIPENELHEVLSIVIPEKELREPLPHKIMQYLGF
ncbi:hypothetical protein COB64_00715 [Candidatus Wolfebacteria bacterium]|nr:MAG: hypothetical protein COB64_00715 [Candidatus Wolfebacteria bacterium]